MESEISACSLIFAQKFKFQSWYKNLRLNARESSLTYQVFFKDIVFWGNEMDTEFPEHLYKCKSLNVLRDNISIRDLVRI